MKNRLFVLLTCLLFGTSSLFSQASGCDGLVIEITNPDTVSVCRGDTVLLGQTNNLNNEGLRWRTTAGFIDAATDTMPRVIPPFSRFYVVEAINADGCIVADSVYIDVDVFAVPQLIADTTLCQNYPIALIQDSIRNVGNTIYNWSPGSLLEDSTDVNTLYIPADFIDTATIFVLISTAANGACTDTQSVVVSLIQSDFEIAGADTLFRCLGDAPLVLTASAQPAPEDQIRWFPSTGVITPLSGASLTVDGELNVTYFAEATINGCYQIDSVNVRIDSLPVTTMTLDPVKDPYCRGDTFFITSPIFDAGDFPLITHSWPVAPGLASPTELYNGIFFASDSALVTRITENGACSVTDTIQVNVAQPPIIQFEPAMPVICPGEPLQITVTFSDDGPAGTLEWEDPDNTLSCDDCLTPVATVGGPTTYSIEVTSEDSECTSEATYEINTIVDVEPSLGGGRICSGDTRRIIRGGINAAYSYRIVGGGIDSTDPFLEVTPPATGTTYEVTTTGLCGTFTTQTTFNFIDSYTLTATGPGSVCPGESATLTAQLSNGEPGIFTWTFNGDLVTSSDNVQVVVPNPEAGTYTVTFADDAGCGTATATVDLEIIQADLALVITATDANGNLIPAGGTIFSGNQVTLMVEGVPTDLDVTYAWDGNYEPETGNQPTLTVTAPREGGTGMNYTVTVTTTEGDCPFSVSFNLMLEESVYRIPELITPNGDGVNDEFRIYTRSDLTDYSLSIFNRWGQRVFESGDPTASWDGNKDGTPQNMDMYLFLATFTINGLAVKEDGEFHLVR
jgi:gliding motility-associated-like protein